MIYQLLKLSLIVGILLVMTHLASAESARIIVDGEWDDWSEIAPLYTDASGDQNSGDIDYGQLWVANDELFLHLRLEVGAEINMQDYNDIRLYLDTDSDAATGFPIMGLGAELVWRFGDRAGQFYVGNNSTSISFIDVGLVTAPTHSSSQFEITLHRDSQPDGTTPLFPDSAFRLAFRDAAGGDMVPETGELLTYEFDDTPLPPLEPGSIPKFDPNHTRLMSYNVLSGGFFNTERQPYFARILNAIQPDIIGFQEIYNQSATEVAAAVEAMLPSEPGQQWYAARENPDIIAVSRFPILESYPIQGNGAFVIDLPNNDRHLLLLVAHPPCCDNDPGRQYEVDAMMAFVHDAITPGGLLDIPYESPIIIMGDMNFVGDVQQLETLLTGQIINQDEFGQSFAPDWDASSFADLHPRLLQFPMTFTWYSANSSFSPGRLDYIIYSDSVLQPGNHFVLQTPWMDADSLVAYDLLPEDTIEASDHFPVVGDFNLAGQSTAIETDESIPNKGFQLFQNYPNPLHLSDGPTLTTIRYTIPSDVQEADVTLGIYNANGQHVRTVVQRPHAPGDFTATWDGRNDAGEPVSSGIYLYRLSIDGQGVAQKQLVLIH